MLIKPGAARGVRSAREERSHHACTCSHGTDVPMYCWLNPSVSVRSRGKRLNEGLKLKRKMKAATSHTGAGPILRARRPALRSASASSLAGTSRTKKVVIKTITSGNPAATMKPMQVPVLGEVSAEYAYQDRGTTEAHCTDWKAPVRPRGLPFSTIRASAKTSVNASPNPMTV